MLKNHMALQKQRKVHVEAYSVVLLPVILATLIFANPIGLLEISVFAVVAVITSIHLYSRLKITDFNPGLAERDNRFIISGRCQLINSVAFSEQTTSSKKSDDALEDLDVMIISRDRSLINQIGRHLDAWKKSYTFCANSTLAISHLRQIDCSIEEPICPSLIIDSRNLDMHPARLPGIIQDEAKLKKLELLYIQNDNDHEVENELLQQGYHAVISLQEIIPQLFSFFKNKSPSSDAENVISLAGHGNDQYLTREPKTILLAEQDSNDRRQLQITLRNAGHKVISVADGDQALENLEHQSFDLVIINLDLPIMNGIQVVRLHRFTTPYKLQVPFIAISDSQTTNSSRICQDLHIPACLYKPVSESEVLDRIDTYLTSREILSNEPLS